MDKGQFESLVKDLYATVSKLEAMFPGRHFTPDGHMVGSIGECMVAHAYGLTLQTASNKGFDAVTQSGKEVEIKATQATSVSFRSEPEHVIAIKILPNGTFNEIYNGPGNLVWLQFAGKKMPSNGQYQIAISKLLKLNKQVSADKKLPRVK